MARGLDRSAGRRALFVIAFALEAGAGYAFCHSDAAAFFGLRFLAGAALAFTTGAAGRTLVSRGATFTLVAPLPPFALLGLVATLWLARTLSRRTPSSSARLLGARPARVNLVRALGARPLTSAVQTILSDYATPRRRIEALMTLRPLDGPSAVPVLRHALRDVDDEVRLLAHALLDRRDEEIQRRIRDAYRRLPDEDGVGNPGVHRALAENHWELVYSGLATGELAEHSLEDAARHATLAADAEPTASNQLLLARILLRQGKSADARVAIVRALGQGASAEVALPLLAETAFQRRRFDAVRERLAELEGDAGGGPLISDVRSFWMTGGPR